MSRQEAGTLDIPGSEKTDARAVSIGRFIRRFGELLTAELKFRKDSGLAAAPQESYYENVFFRNGRLFPLGLAGYAARVEPVLLEIRNLPDTASILDVGCGSGTESILFSFFGREAMGVELVAERLGLASSRADFYRDFSPVPLRLRFQNAEVIRFLQTSPAFDLIWAMEAISHIHPPDEFLRHASLRLKTGETLVISDPNRLNPSAWVKSVRIQGSIRERTHQKFADPETGVPVDYGQEIIFSVFLMAWKLAETGFRVRKIHMSGFMGTSWLPRSFLDHRGVQRLLTAFQKSLRRTPPARYLGSVYTIVAVKDR